VRDRAARERWLKRVILEKIPCDDLRLMLAPPATAGKKRKTLPKPARGRLYAFRLIPAGKAAGETFPWFVDMGFKNVLEAPPSAAKLQNKYLYTSVKTEQGYRLRAANAKTGELFTYQAKVLRVIDGDTLYVSIDQGFGLRIREKLRLKGIDAPEMSTVAGRRAQTWLKKRLDARGYAVVKTHKTDKYDRYLADVFIGPNGQDPQQIASTGAYVNQELIDAGHAGVAAY